MIEDFWGPFAWCHTSFLSVSQHSWSKLNCRLRNIRTVVREGTDHWQQAMHKTEWVGTALGKTESISIAHSWDLLTEGEDFGTTGTSLHHLGLWVTSMPEEREGPRKISLFGSIDTGLGLAIDEHTHFPLLFSLIHFSFLQYFSVILILKWAESYRLSGVCKVKMGRGYSLWIKIMNFMGIFIQFRK